MKKLLLIIAVLIALPYLALGQDITEVEPDLEPADDFYRGEVVEVLKHEIQETPNEKILYQLLKVKLTSGEEKGKEVEIENSGVFTVNGGKGVEAGDKIIIYKIAVQDAGDVYYLADVYRLPSLIWVVGIFFAIAIAFSRWKGVASIAGLIISVIVISKFIVPQIIAGKNPLLITIIGAVIIALVSIYLAHGFSRRTTVALASTLITLGLAGIFAVIFVSVSKLFGMGTEQAFYLQFGPLESLNLRGLLLGGIILGSLGVLDDITTAQSATVDEIKKANPSLGFKELYNRGASVGKEHISSLVNTLFLAYAGAGLPLFLYFTTQTFQPLWVTLNAEFIAEEVIRTLIGSIALILAVPITTVLAAYFLRGDSKAGHAHHH